MANLISTCNLIRLLLDYTLQKHMNHQAYSKFKNLLQQLYQNSIDFQITQSTATFQSTQENYLTSQGISIGCSEPMTIYDFTHFYESILNCRDTHC